ncbi:MAG: phospholipid scramblase-related protein [Cyanobacteriota bacterium]
MERLKELKFLSVSQQVEQVEIFTRYETSNKYRVIDPTGKDIFWAQEIVSNFILMNFLRARRPFVMELISVEDSSFFLKIDRPFRFLFQDATIYGPNGSILGSLEGQVSLLERRFHVLDSRKRKVYDIVGPMFRPWTFHIKSGNTNVGKISKAWSGFAKETFTDADNFGIEFPPHATPELRAVLLGAIFLIDFAYFENSGK